MDDALIININKPTDWTSFDVVAKIRNTTRIKKVGHAGTLDPFATGVLLLLTGKNTKRQNEFMAMSKTYEADISLGKLRDTGDRTGIVTDTQPVPALDRGSVEAVFEQFRGEITQIPPMYSAKKVNGKKLYKLARQGKMVERQPSLVTIHSLDLIALNNDRLKIRVSCGKGTYIRVLAEDIAKSLGTVAYVEELIRTAVGDYRIEDALSIPEFIENWKLSAA
ncbi:MAG: tRNA pseudouridine(55) synthase TruB [Candidatus Marinimicrobia bacterium]|nr:tRNA pseudouridine(55) synthase TruB [Candidatus Neomarinimicrobiota bacterium]MCF7850657.1 tRNA pseudouridine(55) synthase TruB [Candidatus Neomarinimicrobiota bacterium]MCF7905141.1 tRNA pseudouridine(55) synthase TruB [Candidatus Neomarinimicrobiota bacterium]